MSKKRKRKKIITVATKNLARRFLEVFLVAFGFWWGPLGSWKGDPSQEVGDGVVRCQKITFFAELENVQLDLNHLKTSSGNRSFFGGTFG